MELIIILFKKFVVVGSVNTWHITHLTDTLPDLEQHLSLSSVVCTVVLSTRLPTDHSHWIISPLHMRWLKRIEKCISCTSHLTWSLSSVLCTVVFSTRLPTDHSHWIISPLHMRWLKRIEKCTSCTSHLTW